MNVDNTKCNELNKSSIVWRVVTRDKFASIVGDLLNKKSADERESTRQKQKCVSAEEQKEATKNNMNITMNMNMTMNMNTPMTTREPNTTTTNRTQSQPSS